MLRPGKRAKRGEQTRHIPSFLMSFTYHVYMPNHFFLGKSSFVCGYVRSVSEGLGGVGWPGGREAGRCGGLFLYVGYAHVPRSWCLSVGYETPYPI